ncbi:MAG: hypothetical protein CME26_15875 [Gemmatimonadetes bacterium]|nr:hypothetical protein [Gemmatimonadota bacterium]|tara:strand:+ start:5883 stop:6221 length:339 start_codon:yes stop_codon:yes gene_type:complete
MSYPVILAHGFARFDAPIGKGYWDGIPKWIEATGRKTHRTNVDWAGPIAVRAQNLRDQVQAYVRAENVRKVNIIAHSAGGAGRALRHRQTPAGAEGGFVDYARHTPPRYDVR